MASDFDLLTIHPPGRAPDRRREGRDAEERGAPTERGGELHGLAAQAPTPAVARAPPRPALEGPSPWRPSTVAIARRSASVDGTRGSAGTPLPIPIMAHAALSAGSQCPIP